MHIRCKVSHADLLDDSFHAFRACANATSLPRMKGPALLALLPDIPGHCSLLALPEVSPAPLSDERRLDILVL